MPRGAAGAEPIAFWQLAQRRRQAVHVELLLAARAVAQQNLCRVVPGAADVTAAPLSKRIGGGPALLLAESQVGASRLNGLEVVAAAEGTHPLPARRLLTTTANLRFGVQLSELHTGARAFRAAALLSLPLEDFSDDFVFDQQVLATLLEAGADASDGHLLHQILSLMLSKPIGSSEYSVAQGMFDVLIRAGAEVTWTLALSLTLTLALTLTPTRSPNP